MWVIGLMIGMRSPCQHQKNRERYCLAGTNSLLAAVLEHNLQGSHTVWLKKWEISLVEDGHYGLYTRKSKRRLSSTIREGFLKDFSGAPMVFPLGVQTATIRDAVRLLLKSDHMFGTEP